MSNGVNKQRKEIREALLYCLTSEDIQGIVKKLVEIVMNEDSKPMDKIRASQVIFDYTAGKPKQPEDKELYKEEDKSITPMEDIAKGLQEILEEKGENNNE